MKQQIARFSPHQNGKVIAIYMALNALLLVVPFGLLGITMMPRGAGPSIFALLLTPLIYLVVGYLMVLVGCLIYNFMTRFIGGIEFETVAVEDEGPL